MTALVGGVWELEKNVENYTCKHLAETRTVKEETLREKPYIRHSSKDAFYYKRFVFPQSLEMNFHYPFSITGSEC